MKRILIMFLLLFLVNLSTGCSSKRKLVNKQTSTENKIQKELEAYEKNPNEFPERIERAIKLGQIRRDDRELQRYVEALYFVDEYERNLKIKEKEYARYLGSMMIIDEFERKYPQLGKTQEQAEDTIKN